MKNYKNTLAFCVLSILLGATLAAQVSLPAKVLTSDTTVASTSAPNDKYRIGFQDVIDVQVFKHTDLNIRVPVSPNGTITLFRLDKPVVAICKTERELATDIADAYREKYLRNPEVNVIVSEQKSQPISVMGSVEKPGTFYPNRRIHLLELLALAGGPNKESGTRLLIARSGSTSNCKENASPADSDLIAIVDFKIRDVQEGKKTFWMLPGDVVTILDSDIVYVYGNVNKQGSYKIREPITLTQALVSAEGLKQAAKKDKIRILRQRGDNLEREELIFDLNMIDKGKVKDPYLEPNDIVAVSEDKTKSILYGIASSIKATVPNAIYRIPL